MRWTWFAALVVSSLTPIATSQAQQKPPAPNALIKPWEYLVVSFGKTRFGDPVLDPELKQAGRSKVLSYSEAGVVAAAEAVLVQRQMDALGRFGWELVAVVGSIGGDQQMIFKRPFDPDRRAIEAQLIKAEGERIAEEQRNERERLATQKTPDALIDLDEAERQAGVDAEAKLLSDDLATYKDTPFKIGSLDASQDYDGKFKATIRVLVDGTSKLVKENKYRKSEAQALAKAVGDALHTAGKLSNTEFSSLSHVQMSITVTVNHAGSAKPVAYWSVYGDRSWSDGKEKHP